MIYQIVVTMLLLIVLANLVNNLRQFRVPPLAGPLPDPPELVSVLIPARNEEANIANCLNSLLRQDYPHMEILVLDDDSSDRTAMIVADFARRDPRVRLLRGEPLPVGWHGKAYACHQLAQAAKGAWLLFTDADTVHQPASVSSSVRAMHAEGADLLTYIPYLVTGSFWEKVLMPLVAFFPLFLMPLEFITRYSNPRFSMALGPFLLFRTPFYWQIGGHERVRQEICEDMAFGRLTKKHGGRLALLDGKDVVAVRFYHNLGEIWRGWSKSAGSAFDPAVAGFLLFLAIGLPLFIGPHFFLYLALRYGSGGIFPLGLLIIQVGVVWLGRLMMAQRLRLDAWPCFLNVLAMIFGLVVMAYSIAQSRWGSQTWKGRAYSFDEGTLVHKREE